MKPEQSPAERFAVSPNTPKGSGSKSDTVGAAEEEQGPTRILIVDDDFLIASQTKAAPTEVRLAVVGVAITAEEAAALAREQRPFLALMDICKLARRHRYCPRVEGRIAFVHSSLTGRHTCCNGRRGKAILSDCRHS
jgi:hypothetical protein